MPLTLERALAAISAHSHGLADDARGNLVGSRRALPRLERRRPGLARHRGALVLAHDRGRAAVRAGGREPAPRPTGRRRPAGDVPVRCRGAGRDAAHRRPVRRVLDLVPAAAGRRLHHPPPGAGGRRSTTSTRPTPPATGSRSTRRWPTTASRSSSRRPSPTPTTSPASGAPSTASWCSAPPTPSGSGRCARTTPEAALTWQDGGRRPTVEGTSAELILWLYGTGRPAGGRPGPRPALPARCRAPTEPCRCRT